MFSIECNSLRFSRQGTEVLHGIDFQIDKPGIYALLGKNGAGKTTTINLLMGFLQPDSGSCRTFGHPSYALPSDVRAQIGLLHEGFIQYNFMTIAEIEKFYSSFYENWRAEVFWDLVGRMNIPRTRKITRLSCGQRSQVTLGLLLAQQAKVLVLDDFSLGLDVGYRHLFLEYLREYVDENKATVLLTSHVVSELDAYLDHVIVIHKGDMLCNLTRDDFLERYSTCDLPRSSASESLTADGSVILNIEHRTRAVTVCTDRTKHSEFAAILAGAGIEMPAALRDLTTVESAFVGITGRY